MTTAAIVYVVASAWHRTAAAALLPDVPDLTGRPTALVSHIRETNRLARASPRNAEAVGALGVAYHANLLYAEAVAAYSRAEELAPGTWRWAYHRALVHLERAEAREAGEALRQVVAAQPDHALAWWRLGETALKQARYDEADAAYTRAEKAAGGDAAGVGVYARVGRARVALLGGDAVKAESILIGVIESDVRFAPAHRLLAESLRAQGRPIEAERHATRAAALRAYAAPVDPIVSALADQSRSSVFLLRQAAALDLAREPARREQLVRRAVEVDPENPDVVYEMGSLLQQLRRPADALVVFLRHLEMVQDDVQTLVQIGKCQIDLSRPGDAEQTLGRALALGDDAVGFHNLGVALEQQDRLGEAENSYRRAIALDPGLARARNNLGGLLARRGRLAEASTLLAESIRLDPSSPDAYTNLSALLLERRAYADAARYARLAVDVDPRHANAHVNLGVALANLGDLDGAREHLAEALRIAPGHVDAGRNLDLLGRRRR